MTWHWLSRTGLAIGLIMVLGGFGSLGSLFAPKPEPWPRWEAHDDANAAEIDFRPWTALLAKYVRPTPGGVNLFDYGAVTADDKAALKRVIADLAQLPVLTYSRTQQLAYWINLYNALTVDVVLEHYPVASIRDIDISPGLFADGPWGKALVTVDGQPLSLNEIEHRILRPIWHDARVHYAVNCASLGCPNLQPEAFVGDRIDAQLDAAAQDYVNNWRGVSIDGDRFVVSSIYDWFSGDFGGGEAEVKAHLLHYARPALADAIRSAGAIDEGVYDWRLNDASPATRDAIAGRQQLRP